MKVIQKRLVEQQVMTSITCNNCGREHKTTGEMNDFDLEQFQSFEFSFGYGSKRDGEVWEFDLCEDCIVEVTSKFAIQPFVTEY